MAIYIHLTGNDNPIPPPVIYVKSTNNVGGWSYAARPEAKDSKFYELDGEWFYVVKDKAELISLRDQGSWMTSTNPNQLVSITDIYGVTKSIPINNLVTTRVNNMSEMFIGGPTYGSQFNQIIPNWDVSNVTDMSQMFTFSVFNQYIGNWDTGNLVLMDGIFASSLFDQWIARWDVRNVTNMRNMFYNNTKFNQDLSSWCVSAVTNNTLFDYGATAWTLPKPNFANPPC